MNKKNHCDEIECPDHSAELGRLNRISGQLEGVKKMIEDRRYCPEIITQLRAIQSATRSVESNMLRRHLEGCVIDACGGKGAEEAEEKINELITLFKRYH